MYVTMYNIYMYMHMYMQIYIIYIYTHVYIYILHLHAQAAVFTTQLHDGHHRDLYKITQLIAYTHRHEVAVKLDNPPTARVLMQVIHVLTYIKAYT
jgi:hypothetical protein